MRIEIKDSKESGRIAVNRDTGEWSHVPDSPRSFQMNFASSKGVRRMRALKKFRTALGLMPWLECYNKDGIITLTRKARKEVCDSAGISRDTLNRTIKILREDYEKDSPLSPILFAVPSTRSQYIVNPHFSTKGLPLSQVPMMQAEWLHYVGKAFKPQVVHSQDTPKLPMSAAIRRAG